MLNKALLVETTLSRDQLSDMGVKSLDEMGVSLEVKASSEEQEAQSECGSGGMTKMAGRMLMGILPVKNVIEEWR